MESVNHSRLFAKPEVKLAIADVHRVLRGVLPEGSFGERESMVLAIADEAVRELLQAELQGIADSFGSEILVDGGGCLGGDHKTRPARVCPRVGAPPGCAVGRGTRSRSGPITAVASVPCDPRRMRLACVSALFAGLLVAACSRAPGPRLSPEASTPDDPPLPAGGGIGTEHPITTVATSTARRWAVVCQARVDTDGDGIIAVGVGIHGETYGDRMEPFLVLGSGPGTPIADFVDVYRRLASVGPPEETAAFEPYDRPAQPALTSLTRQEPQELEFALSASYRRRFPTLEKGPLRF